MDLTTIDQSAGAPKLAVTDKGSAVLDPFDKDCPEDVRILTTRRALTRVVLVAVETGGRFAREGIEYDPMSWMLASRELFSGRSAIDACLEREHCIRSVLVHGLSLGLDLSPSAVDALLADDDIDGAGPDPKLNRKKDGLQKRQRPVRRSFTTPRLFTATISYSDHSLLLQAFHASIARDASEISERLRRRFGRRLTEAADIREGFHRAAPVTIALVQEPVAEMIRRVVEYAHLQIHDDFAVTIEQRIDV